MVAFVCCTYKIAHTFNHAIMMPTPYHGGPISKKLQITRKLQITITKITNNFCLDNVVCCLPNKVCNLSSVICLLIFSISTLLPFLTSTHITPQCPMTNAQ